MLLDTGKHILQSLAVARHIIEPVPLNSVEAAENPGSGMGALAAGRIQGGRFEQGLGVLKSRSSASAGWKRTAPEEMSCNKSSLRSAAHSCACVQSEVLSSMSDMLDQCDCRVGCVKVIDPLISGESILQLEVGGFCGVACSSRSLYLKGFQGRHS